MTKSNHKKICLLMVVLLIVGIFAGCGTKKDAAGEASDVIKIGVIAHLSGEAALWGQAGLNGAQLTAKEINEKGGILGKKVVIVGLDGKGDPVDSVNAFNKLVDSEKVVVVIGTNWSGCNIAMAPIADQKKVPLIGTATSNPKVTVDDNGKLHPYSFRIGFIDPFQGKVLASLAKDEIKAKTAAVIVDIGSDYSTGLSEFFIEQFEANGGEIVAQVDAHSGDNDFRAQLSKIAAEDPDVLLIPWIHKDVALISNQARELGIEAVLLGGDGWDSKELIEMAGPAMQGGYYTSQPSFANPATQPFAEMYKKEFKIEPETEALFYYDGLYWVKNAFERAGKVDSEALKDALESTVGFQGLMGELTIDPKTHNPEKACSVYKVEGNEFVYVGDFAP